MNRHAGFTLPELIMVMVLVGVLGAVGIPRFFDLDDYQARFVYDQVLSAARYGHQAAVASGCATRLSISATGFQLLSNDNCLSGTTPAFSNNIVPHPTGDSEAFNLTSVPSGASLTSATVTFYPDGSADNNHTLSVSGRNILITAATGYVR